MACITQYGLSMKALRVSRLPIQRSGDHESLFSSAEKRSLSSPSSQMMPKSPLPRLPFTYKHILSHRGTKTTRL